MGPTSLSFEILEASLNNGPLILGGFPSEGKFYWLGIFFSLARGLFSNGYSTHFSSDFSKKITHCVKSTVKNKSIDPSENKIAHFTFGKIA